MVFAVFSVFYLGQGITLNYAIGFALIAVGAYHPCRCSTPIAQARSQME